MLTGFWGSLLLGSMIAVLYAAGSYATLRYALSRPTQQFFVLVFGGMTARLFITAAVMTLVLVFVPVVKVAFLGSFSVGFILGLTVEVIALHHRQKQSV
ncbi:MAG: hypothetical protein COV99_08660 [Bacteroidetes bacterium CG12_big_fil_rev_8_21_14_0_65_60_17]|nr:MAG: hypothetical protein COV99_08660 [Bacteroidetes bacterium CG12_big_fil_rev_8_21_14_0_65_60_17]